MTTHYTVYRITNTTNNKIYIGVHKTQNPYDSYLGSGIVIKDAIKKYGRGAFLKEVLFIFESKSDAYAKERELVNEEFILRDDTYNLTVGGVPTADWSAERQTSRKGFAPFAGKKHTTESKRRISESGKGRIKSQESVDKARATRATNKTPSYWKGRTQSLLSNEKRSQSHKTLPRLACPHCGKSCDPGNAKLHHYDNCKHITDNPTSLVGTKLTSVCPHCGKVGQLAALARWHFNNCKLKLVS